MFTPVHLNDNWLVGMNVWFVIQRTMLKPVSGELSTSKIDELIKEIQIFYLLSDADRKLTWDESKFIEDFI